MMKKWLVAFIGVFLLSGCLQTAVPTQQLPEITFQHLKALPLNVAKIEMVDETAQAVTASGKHVEQRFPTSPKRAVSNWVRDRLKAYGTTGLARITLKEASAVEEKLTKKTGLTGFFTDDQSERYTTRVNVRLDLFDDNGNLRKTASAQASRHSSVAEDYSLLQREKVWFDLVEKMMVDFDKVMVEQINRF